MLIKQMGWAVASIALALTARAQVRVVEPIPPTAAIDVYASRADSHAIPRTIFGTFLEPIGNSTYNGLWAELLENPSFESGLWSPQRVADMLREEPALARAGELALPLPWEPLDAAQGNRYEVHYGDAANSWQSLRLFGLPAQPTGIRQRVYLPIHRTRRYVGSFYARHIDGAPAVTVALRLRNQPTVLASQQLQVSASAWTKYEFALEVPAGKLHRLEPADFVLEVEGDARVEFDQASLLPADAVAGLDPDAVSLARAMHTPLVRFGGNFTSSYRWTDGIGPRDRRLSMINNSWGIPEYNTFGTDEFLEFCRQIGAQPQIALNLGSGTPEDAAAWVRYVNQHWTTHSGLLWELGNELWGNWNLAYPTQAQLAARTARYSQAIHAVDPDARLIATGADPDGFESWNATQLTNPPGTFADLSTHFVVNTDQVQLPDASPDFVAAAGFAMPVELARRLRAQQQQIDATPGYRDKAHIAFTEWLFAGGRNGAPSFTNMGGAVLTGGFLNMLLRNSDIVPISDMTGIMEFAGIWKKRSQVFATPAYYVFRLYASADADRTLATDVRSGSYSVQQGVDRLPRIDDVPYLDVVATRSHDGRTLTLFCVNRSLDADIPAEIHLHDFAAAQARVQVVRSGSIVDANDELRPTRIHDTDETEPVPAGAWTHTFPHASISVITLRHN